MLQYGELSVSEGEDSNILLNHTNFLIKSMLVEHAEIREARLYWNSPSYALHTSILSYVGNDETI